jgi:hypothetical protein
MRFAIAVVAVFALALVAPTRAQTFKIDPDLFGQKKPAPKPPSVNWNVRPSDPAAPAKPAVVCGMTVVPADPKVDPKMRVAPTDTRTRYVLTVVEPTVCTGPQR